MIPVLRSATEEKVMAFYIDFNFINIRDLIDLTEVDLEFENQLQNLAEQVFENPLESPANPADDFEESAIKFLSEIVVENDTKQAAETSKKDVAEVILKPIAPSVTIQKPAVNKNEAYIKYINSKYEHDKAEYFINVLLNPVKTHLRNRFDYADVRSSYLSNRILGKDKETAERAEENRRREDENLRNAEAERRIESLKKVELNKFFELKVKEQFKRV